MLQFKFIGQDKKKLLENFFSLGLVQLVSYIIPLISLPYLSRVLSTECFGKVFFAYSFVQYFIMITDFGFGLSAVKDISANRDNILKRDEIFNAVIMAKLFLSFVCFIILCIIVITISKFRADCNIYFLTFLMVIGNAISPIWFFQGIEHMKYITFLNILSKLIFLLLLFCFIKNNNQYIFVPLINSLGFIVSGILGLYLARKRFNVNYYFPPTKIIINQLKNSFDFFLSRISASIFTNTNSFCLGLVSSPSLVAYYVAAEKIYDACDQIYAPINNVLYPYMVKEKNIIFYKKIFLISLLISIVVCLFIFVFSKNIVSIFYGFNMLQAYKILRIFSIILIIKIPATMLGYPLLAAFGYTKETNISVIISSIIHVIGLSTLFAIDKLNVYSISIMVGVSVLTLLINRLYYILKNKLLVCERRCT